MTHLVLEMNEKLVGHWTIMYQTPYGSIYNGTIWVSNKKLYYESLSSDSSNGLNEESFFVSVGKKGYLSIPKEDIVKVEARKNFISKQIILTLKNGQTHIFDHGMLSIDKIVEAIHQH